MQHAVYLTLLVIVCLVAIYYAYKVHSFGKSCTLKTNFRRLWYDHALYSRLVICAHISSDTQLDFLSRRLLKCQDSLSDVVREKLGKENGDRLSLLLKEHTSCLITVLNLANNSGNGVGYSLDKDSVRNAVELLRKNGESLCNHLATINEKWARADLLDSFNLYLDHTVREIDLRAKHDLDEDLRNFDDVMNAIAAFSDKLHRGLA